MIAPPPINMKRTVVVGTGLIQQYESKQRKGFYDTIPKETETMTITGVSEWTPS